jgi:insulin receptor
MNIANCLMYSVFGRKKRQVDTTTENGENDSHAIEFQDKPTNYSSHNQATGIASGENHTNTYDNNRLVTFYQKVTGTSYTVVGVRHYAEYTIKVIACHDHDPISNKTLCSLTAALTSARTKQSCMHSHINYCKLLTFFNNIVCNFTNRFCG